MGESGMSTKAKAVRIAAGSGAVLSLGASLVATAGPAGAATFNVTTTADAGAGSLRQAILDANGAAGPDTITFQAGLGTIGLTSGHLNIIDDLTITDPEGDVTIDAGGNSRIFYINNTGGVTLSGLTLTDGFVAGDGGAINSSDTDLTITNSTITGNEASGLGGGVYAINGTVTVTDSTFSDNYAEGYGGGLAVFGAESATVTGSTFTGNDAQYYGGGATFDNVTTIAVTDSTFTDNYAGGYGGGFWAYDAETLTVTSSTFTGNDANGDGGGFGTEGVVSVTVTDSTFTGNYAGSDGGAFSIYGDGVTNAVTITGVTATDGESPDQAGGVAIQTMASGTVTVADSTFSDNSGNLGGGLTIGRLNAEPVAITISGSTFSGNDATSIGGGLYLGDNLGTTTITSSTFSGNTAGGGEGNAVGGGIGAEVAGTVTVDSSTISGNTASIGGGIFAYETVLSVVNSTVSGNTAQYAGGGIALYGDDGTNSDFSHSTITGNTAGVGGGVFLAGYGTVTLDHDILDGNVATGQVLPTAAAPTYDDDGAAIFISAGRVEEPLRPYEQSTQALDSVTLTNNLVNGTIAGVVVDGGGNLFDLPANLGPLADNGGPTQTHNLLAGSAALDAGDAAFAAPPSTDQRGLPRVANARIDIGAVEVQVQTPVVPPVAPPAEPVPADPTFTG